MAFISQDVTRKANDLVRLALFNEQRRMPLRRDDISKKGAGLSHPTEHYEYLLSHMTVLGSKSRKFAEVLAVAQDILERTFGMQLVELQHQAEEQSAEKDAVGMKKKGATLARFAVSFALTIEYFSQPRLQAPRPGSSGLSLTPPLLR